MKAKKKNKTVSQLAEKAAVLLQKLRRMEESNFAGYVQCVTCGKPIHWKEAQGCHFISRRYSFHKLREENIHPGCAFCNGPMRGNLIAYTLFMEDKFGREYVEWLESTKNEGRKWVRSELEELIDDFKKRIKEQEDRLAGV